MKICTFFCLKNINSLNLLHFVNNINAYKSLLQRTAVNNNMYLCNLMLSTFDISIFHLTEFIVQNIKVYDIGLQRYRDYISEFVAKTQFLWSISFATNENQFYQYAISVSDFNHARLVFPFKLGIAFLRLPEQGY